MSHIKLVQGHVVNMILSFPSTCGFPNYGGRLDGNEELLARILNSFSVTETGHLQGCYTNKKLSMAKVLALMESFIDDDKLEDLVDLWKEVCNHSDSSELRQVGYSEKLESMAAKRDFTTGHFLEIIASKLKYDQKSSIGYFFDSAMNALANASNAKNESDFDYHVNKLNRVLVTYPFIQPTFIAEAFGQEFLDTLAGHSNASVRASLMLEKIKRRYNKLHEAAPAPEEKKEGFKMWGQQTIYEGKERFVHFMGIEHLVQSAIAFSDKEDRVDQELSLIHNTLHDLINKSTMAYAIYAKGIIKSIIHRSSHQEKLCRDVLIDPSNWAEFEKADPRKRGMIVDEILETLVKDALPKVKVEKVPADLSHHPAYPNLTEEEEPVKDSLYMQLIKVTHPEVYEAIKVTGDESEENINSILGHHIKLLGITDGKEVENSFKYEYPKALASGVIIKGDPDHPMVQELAKMFNVDIDKVKPVEEPKPETPTDDGILGTIGQIKEIFESSRPFKSRLNENLDRLKTGMDRVNKIEAIARELDVAFEGLTGIDPSTLNGDCQDPSCPVHGNVDLNLVQSLLSKRQPHPMDHFIGIERLDLNPEKAVAEIMKGRKAGLDYAHNLFKTDEPKVGTEMVKRILLIGMERHEMMFNTDTNRVTIFVDEQQLFTGIVENESQANFVWGRYKKGVEIGVGQNAIAAAIAELNGL